MEGHRECEVSEVSGAGVIMYALPGPEAVTTVEVR